MNKLILLILMVALMSIGGLNNAHAKTAPYQLSIINPLQLIPERDSIKGVRINFGLGVNQNMYGIDIGMINQVDGDQRGLQFGIFNSSFKTTGVQIGLINMTEHLEGLQIGILNFHNEGNLKIMPIINFKF